MKWTGLLCVVGLATPAWSAQAAEPGRAPAEGTIETDTGRVELLSEPVPVGRRIELPEGWYQVEAEGDEDGAVGSFTVLQAGTGSSTPEPSPPGAVAELQQPPPEVRPSPGPAASPALACRAQRSAFYRELWRQSGVEVDDPDALLDGLDAGTSGPAAGYYWFALQADPFRNLAWSSELRGRANELVRCVREAGAASGR